MATTRFHDGAPDVDGLYADLAAADLQPLWVQPGLLTRTPGRLTPHIWRWKTLRDLAERSGDLVGIERGGDRRVLSLAHPDLGGLPFATHTLWGAVQFLGGGELAPAHRHTPAALRFVLEGSGVWTLVNGDPIHMAPGDLVLTPSWTWHEHHNPGTEPMIWFDGLDLPLVRNLDAVFFEPGGEELTRYEPVPRVAIGAPLRQRRAAAGGRRAGHYRGPGVGPVLQAARLPLGRHRRRPVPPDRVHRAAGGVRPLRRPRDRAGHHADAARGAAPAARRAPHADGPDGRQRDLGRLPRIGRDGDRRAPLPLGGGRHVRHPVVGSGRSRGRRRRRPVPPFRRAGARRARPRPHRANASSRTCGRTTRDGETRAAGELRRRPGGLPGRRPGDPPARPDDAGRDRRLGRRGAGGSGASRTESRCAASACACRSPTRPRSSRPR